MVTVLGHRGLLGSVVERRWREMGWDGDYVVNCLPDDLGLIVRLAALPGLIQPSSDAIAEDTEYAAGKRAIERVPGIVVIRAGLVDPRKVPGRAFINWHANPLTPLEWADLAWEKRDQPGVHVAGRERRSRYDIVCMVADAFGQGHPRPAMSAIYRDRTQPQDRRRPPLKYAVDEYREWLG